METSEERGDGPRRQAVEEDDGTLSVPRGGPIYIPNLVGPLTSVADFESSLLLQLQNLEAVLASSDPLCGEDLSVDELKVFTEEELVDMAMKEAFQGEENNENPSRASEERYAIVGKEADISGSTTKHVCSESFSRGENVSSSFETINGSPLVARSIKNDKSRKRKERQASNHSYELVSAQNSYTAKVEDLVNIKQKQEADKAVARLHSFNGSCKMNESAITLSEKTERMKSLRFTSSVTKVRSSSVVEHIAVQCPEVVLSVEVYHSLRKWVKTQEFLVLGRQTLAELRDKIYCLTDQMMQKAGQHDPSGYFFIEDVFCNDLRDPSAIDYSEPIFDWLRNSRDEALKKWESIITGELQQKQKAIVGDVTGLQLPRFKAVEMHMIRFCDLRFRLGAGYLYCHQGDCKHTIVIRDMRLIHPEDVHNRADYPIVLFQLKFRVQKCDVCKIYRATKVTVDDKWAQKNPCYFCKDCYFLLHYGKDESLLYGDFSVYDYQHD